MRLIGRDRHALLAGRTKASAPYDLRADDPFLRAVLYRFESANFFVAGRARGRAPHIHSSLEI
jgi:hypothetical protein